MAGCIPNFETVDEACKDPLPGEQHMVAPSEVMTRIGCYRRFVGLAAGKITRTSQEAAASHAGYLELNRVLASDPTVGELFLQDPDMPGFSGETLSDRLQASGAFDPTSGEGMGFWNIFLYDINSGIDDMVTDPYLRDAFFQPLWVGAGYGELANLEGGTSGYINMMYAFPPARRMHRPVVYPKHGQTDVPLAYVVEREGDFLGAVGDVIGFPITLTVGSESISGRDNPYELVVERASLTGGPQFEVPLTIVEPGSFPWGTMRATVILAPTVPLLPSVEYTLEADIRWNMGPKTVKVNFTTTSDGTLPTGF
jgi:hypothetical protein